MFFPHQNKSAFLVLLLFFLNGCTVVHFSANYYDPPAGYKEEVATLWQDVTAQMGVQGRYQFRIVDRDISDKLNGVPSVSNGIVMIPEDFIKYVYQNYYDDRYFIIGSVMVHEMMHPQLGLPSQPPEEHVKTDLAAIKVLGENEEMIKDYVRALDVMHNYWFARKGMGGHALNVGWNLANAAAVAFTGTGYFRDWFATDLKVRMKMIKKHYGVRVYSSFERTPSE